MDPHPSNLRCDRCKISGKGGDLEKMVKRHVVTTDWVNIDSNLSDIIYIYIYVYIYIHDYTHIYIYIL